MNTKDQLYDNFLYEWQAQFDNFKAILSYLNTYPEELTQVNEFHWTKLSNIEWEQKEWIWLLSKFDNPIDITYFKPWWIPVNALQYDQFIDISSPVFELFQIEYSYVKPYYWFKYPLIRDVPQFMLSVDNNSGFISKEKENTALVKKNIIDEMFRQSKIWRLKNEKGSNLDSEYRDLSFTDDVDPIID